MFYGRGSSNRNKKEAEKMTVPMNEMAWCPGCGNFLIAPVVEDSLKELGIAPKDAVIACGIGQAAKLPHYLDINYFNGLHGRSLPLAVGIKLARPELKVIAVSGDGCMYGEGGNHFLHTIRKNLDITILVHDNQVYALTKGQCSPTTEQGIKHPLAPQGNPSHPLSPLSLAINIGAPFVARGFAGDKEHLKLIIKEAISFKGTAVVDILQPCVSFNKINTFQWYKERVKKLEAPLTDRYAAMQKAEEWGAEIPIGVIYKNEELIAREIRTLFKKEVKKDSILALLAKDHK